MKREKTLPLNLSFDKREIRKDAFIAKKYIKYFIFLSALSLSIIFYNYKNFELNKTITNLSLQKQYLEAQNFELKQKITELSSPKRIDSIARTKLDMKPVTYDEVKFLDK